MPPWNYIEDASAKTPRIWLSRPLSESDLAGGTRTSTRSGSGTSHYSYVPPSAGQTGQCVYRPLRKVDCRAINERLDMLNAAGVPVDESSTQLGTILVESGRATADLDARHLAFNFINCPRRALLGAAWFTRIERDGDVVLHPLSEVDGDRVERLYLRAVSASSSLSDTSMDDVLRENVDLEDERGYKATICKVGRTLTMKKKSSSLFGTSLILQRGYGEYRVPGEEDESCLAPPRNLLFVIHGIGEALWSRDDCSVPGVVASTDQARDGMNRKLADAWRADCQRCEKAGEPLPSPPHRIELIPIEWYSKIHSASSELKNTLLATTLDNIPRLRAIANDVVFDVLTYLTPSFTQEVLETVTKEIAKGFERFNKIHPNFAPAGGKTSLIGHSLGSVIAWDLLSILKDKKNGKSTYEPGHTQATHEVYAKEDEAGSETRKAGHWGPILTRDIEVFLPFVPESTIFLGSPLGLFLSLRGAHPVLDELRKKSNKFKRDVSGSSEGIDESLQVMVSEPDSISTKVSPFTLPSGEIFNIFHPADPVAYRIEPLLLPPGTPDRSIPPPAYLTADKGVRLHIQLQEATKNISKSVSGLLGGLTMGNAGIIAAVANVSQEAERRLSSRRSSAAGYPEEIKFALGGRSTRVDHQLQTGIVENEYLSAVTAHGIYWNHNDILDFVINLSAKVVAKSERLESVDDHGWEKKESSRGEVSYA